jgi:hypothetical protein
VTAGGAHRGLTWEDIMGLQPDDHHLTVDERPPAAARKAVPRSSHAAWIPEGPDDAVTLLTEQDADRAGFLTRCATAAWPSRRSPSTAVPPG